MNFITRPLSRPGIVAALLLFVLLSNSRAADYWVKHDFKLKPGGNQIPVVRGKYYCHAWTTETRPDCSDSAVNPDAAAQPLGWGPFGTDSQHGTQGPVRNSGNGGGGVNSQTAQIPIDATGAGGFFDIEWATASDCDAYADANSMWSVNQVVAGGEVTGTITAWGVATAAGAPHRRSTAYAFSMTSIEAQGSTLKKGKLKWHSVVRDTVRGSRRSQKDPIDYIVTDLVTGARVQGTLLSISMDMLPASLGGGINWDSNQVVISATDMNLRIEIPGQLTSLTGRVDLQIRGGIVEVANASGIYAGILPAVGSAVPVAFNMINDIEFDYDLTSLTPAGNDTDVVIDMYGSGEAVDESASEETALTMSLASPTGDPGLTVSWPATPGRVYTLETTQALTGRGWLPFPAAPLEHRGSYYVMVGNSAPAQFFRLVAPELPPCEIHIHQQPISVTVPAGEPAMFFVEASGNPFPEKYQWQRQVPGTDSFEDVPGANGPTLFFDPGSDPFTYNPPIVVRCLVSNGCTTKTSEKATLTVLPAHDTTPPQVQAAIAECPAPAIVVIFSEPVAPELAMIPNNYQLRSLNITGPRVLEARMIGPNLVHLILSGPIAPSGTMLTVRNVRDLAGNPIPPGNSTPVNCGGDPAAR